ncbi:MAG: 4Fe-4S dicluster-binding protein [Bacteroidales bacterium]
MSMPIQKCHPVIDADGCIWCEACVEACPNDVISIDDEKHYTFRWTNCDCTERCKDACPVDAIHDFNEWV